MQLRDYLYFGIAVVGLLLTAMVSGPGTHVATTGPFRFDAFYASVYGFGFLFLVSVYRVSASKGYGLARR